MRLSDLRDRPIVTEEGERCGRVHEVHCDKGAVVALMCGTASLIERWTGKKTGRRIPWDEVVKIGANEIVIRSEKASGARSRRGTRQASAPRSKR